jgi:hypothetical protein
MWSRYASLFRSSKSPSRYAFESRDVKQGRIVFQFEASSLIPGVMLSLRSIWRGANIQLTPQ